MKLMLSIWLAFLALIPITKDLPNAEDIQNQFLDAVDDEYQQYQILNDLSYYSTDLELIVVRGIYNNLPCYGISFYSDKFDVVISTVDGLYSLYYYGVNNRYYFNILSLIIFTIIMLLISSNSLRRQKYDNI